MKRTRIVSIAFLFAYVVFLIAAAITGHSFKIASRLTLFELLGEARSWKWLVRFALQLMIDCGRFLPFGFLVANVLPTRSFVFSRLAQQWFLSFPVSLLLASFVRGFEFGRGWVAPGFPDMILATIGCALGVWFGSNWTRGPKARLWLVPKFFATIAVVVCCVMLLLFYGTDSVALGFSHPTITTVDKQRAWDKIREGRSDARRDALNRPGETRRAENQLTYLNLNGYELTTLLNMAAGLFPYELKARVDLSSDSLNAQLSARLPSFRGHERYLNLIVGAKSAAQGGRFDFELVGLQLGQINFPEKLLPILSWVIRLFIRYDRIMGPIVKSTETVKVTSENLFVAYREDLAKKELASLFGGGTSEALVAATKLYIDHLLKNASAIRDTPEDDRLMLVLNTVFKYAQERSETNDPILENKAAILALNMAYGDVALARFVGEIANDRTRRLLRQELRSLPILGHLNWSENFFIAGAITVTASEAASDALSILKEELDKQTQKTNDRMFSLADLLSRKTGTRFAQFAIQDVRSARALQTRLAAPFRLGDFYPSPEGLHEDIRTDATLETSSGKVRGANFDQYLAEIERRLNRCAGYQPPS